MIQPTTQNNDFLDPESATVSIIELQEIFADLAKTFLRAENKLVDLQRMFNLVHVPSLNQLRYVGYHMAATFENDH